jgi:hypothetical protein
MSRLSCALEPLERLNERLNFIDSSATAALREKLTKVELRFHMSRLGGAPKPFDRLSLVCCDSIAMMVSFTEIVLRICISRLSRALEPYIRLFHIDCDTTAM